uniref:Uncharacterized protein n=1 Tax=Rhizophora mucronata TaxID=61149 RepID=A0A2P2PXY5_RHIMU
MTELHSPWSGPGHKDNLKVSILFKVYPSA